ncbi:protein DpdH [Pseudomonas sp. NPDC090202]|uniref:protein DpdH n=1 Tax=Pseudomonas sp. NPDC090202 TaxID=3364476 RepID=UPI00383047EF
MSLLSYWPSADEINDCIKHEAEGAHDAVLLAVHKPSPLSYKQISSSVKFEASEEDLFKYLITKDVPSGVHIVPITGASGVGKSHMVRILTARLQSTNDDDRYVIIRIPKSASLRKVVELILEKLPGEEYASVKAEFSKAFTEELKIETAVIRFQRELDIALGELTKGLEARVRANPRDSVLKEQWGHAASLPKFMGDPVLVDYFREKVFPRFVQRAIAGQSQAAQEEYVKDFDAGDFQLPDTIDISRAASPTHAYYTRTLLVREGEGMRTVARLLNESKVVDQAIRQVFNLHQSLGGMTLQEVIQEIRRLLLKQQRELVIFVEDFKALTGIQDILLKVLIQEGVRNGVRELATMRSVIAVTDGYLDSEDTIATRAKREWKVESELSSEQVLVRTKALVASYLNAARWGYRELVRHFEIKGGAYAGQEAWIEPYADHEDTSDDPVLAAFGKEGEIPLFPYTEQAIEQLARSVLTRNNALVFTPRFIIDNILRGLLLPGRPAFERGQFPPPDVNAPGTNAEVTQWLASLPVSEDVRERYRRVVAIWGNAPRTSEEIGCIPKEVFDAFKLNRPDIEFRSAVQNKQSVDLIQPLPDSQPKPDDEYLIQALERWVQNSERLSQTVANQIRKSIESALNERIDWSAERCVKIPISWKQISIPNAGGDGGVATNAIVVSVDNTDPTGQLRAELAAVTRFYHLNNGKMQYSGVDDDLCWIGNLSDRLMPSALVLVHASMRQRLGTAVRLLSTNSRILGLIDRGRTPASLAAFLFGAPNFPRRQLEEPSTDFGNWRAMQEQALQIRSKLQELVTDYCGSFQGTTGKILYAVDMVRVSDCLLPESETTNLGVFEFLPSELRSALAIMSEARVGLLVGKVSQGAGNICIKLKEEFGDNFDKQEIAEGLRALADQLKEFASWSVDDIGLSYNAFKTLCEEFRGGALREALSILASAGEGGEGPNDGKLVTRMARFDVHPLIVASRFVDASRKVLRASEKMAKRFEDQSQGVDPQAQASEIQTLFEGLLNEMDALGVDGETVCS